MDDPRADFFSLYLRYVGTSEVPPSYHLWAGISMVAACLSDRVWYEKFRGEKLFPNLYTFLVGPSGIGKGGAIRAAVRLIRHLPIVNMYQGKTTAAHLIEYMASPRRVDEDVFLESTRIFLVTPELADTVGSGPVAEQFVRSLTNFHEGNFGEFHEGTRTAGHFVLDDPCINWLAGTTVRWLISSVTPESIESGFFGRVAPVVVDESPPRVYRPSYPDDYDAIVLKLTKRVGELTGLGGRFTIAREADAIQERWYYDRAEPEDEALKSSFRREDDLVMKLSMILSVADRDDLVILPEHVVRAQQLVGALSRTKPRLITFARMSKHSEGVHHVREYIKRKVEVSHSTLLRAMTGHGMTAAMVAECVTTIKLSQEIEDFVRGEGRTRAVWYRWVTTERTLGEE